MMIRLMLFGYEAIVLLGVHFLSIFPKASRKNLALLMNIGVHTCTEFFQRHTAGHINFFCHIRIDND